MVNFVVVIILLATISTPLLCSASNILFLVPFPVKSHWLWLNHFVQDLLDRGHHLTTLTSFPTKQPHENLTEIIIDPMFDIPAIVPKSVMFEMHHTSGFENVDLVRYVGEISTKHVLKDPKVKALIADKSLKFDLVILVQFSHESFLMFAHKFKCPIVTIGTLTYSDNMDHAMGTLSPWSIVPNQMLSFSGQMTFEERAYNALISLYDNMKRYWVHLPLMQSMAEEHFKGHVEEPMPHVRDLERNVSFMLINSHRATDPPRPKMPGLVDVGGAHIKPAKPLPPDLQDFLDNSKNGVIYFSLGSYVEGTDMPPEKTAMILRAFSKLKQNVLWKFENENMKNLPPNVLIQKWMPQNDILAHPNVKVFMTHSGVFGTQEGIYWGKMMLCIPLYADQHRNSLKAIRGGFARSLNFAKMTEEDILKNLHLLLTDPSYEKNAKEMSARFRDNPIHPLEEASYWIEYTIRHGGAQHIKSHGVYLRWYQNLLLDVLGCVLLAVLISIWVVFKVVRVVRGFFTMKSNQCDKEKKKK